MARYVTCSSIGVYGNALTRGRQYEVLAERPDGQVKLRGNNQRARWYPAYAFAGEGEGVPTLVRWWFEHAGITDIPLDEWEDVEFELSDGTLRWCSFVTPLHLKRLLESPDRLEPGIWVPQVIVVRSLEPTVVEAMLRHLDDHGELLQASRPIG